MRGASPAKSEDVEGVAAAPPMSDDERTLVHSITCSVRASSGRRKGSMQISAQDMPPPIALYRMIGSFYVSRAIHVMAHLGIADILSDGPVHAEELARRTKTHASSLKRVLRLLVTAGVVAEDEEGWFGLTAIGDCLRTGVSGSMRAVLLLFGGITERAWGELLYSVETGEPAFRRVFGKDSFAYFAEHPEEAANFDAAMSAFTAPIAAVVATAYEFSGVRHGTSGSRLLIPRENLESCGISLHTNPIRKEPSNWFARGSP
jgi:Dimerisation domain